MNFETVNYTLENNVATVQMNRPEALNALSLQLSFDLRAAFEKAIADKARAVILTGSGRAFCSGGDLREMQSMWKKEGRIEAFLEDPLKALHDVIVLIREDAHPVHCRSQRSLCRSGNKLCRSPVIWLSRPQMQVLTRLLSESACRPIAGELFFFRVPLEKRSPPNCS